MKKVLLVAFGLLFVGCSNPSTPAGYIGYVTKGAWFGHEQFYDLQVGPKSPGMGWLLYVQNVSITPYTYNEPMEVLSHDNLRVSFQIHLIWRVRPTPEAVKAFIEHYSQGAADPDKVAMAAYANYLKEPLRTAARDEVQALDALAIKDKIAQMGPDIEGKMKQWVANTPFEIMNIVAGDLKYPDQVANAVSSKMATTQLLEQKSLEIAIEEKERTKRVVQSRGIAEAMEIINQRLSPTYLQHEAIEAQKAMVNSPNHTTIYIPVGPMGVPVVGTIPQKQ